MGVNFNKIINTGWLNLKRNSYLSFGTMGVMTLTLILFLGLLSLQFLSSSIIISLQNKVDISAYFKDDATEDQIIQIQADLKNLSEVDFVDYISRQRALDDFRARHADDQLIQESLDQLDDNPLSASLNIKAKGPGQYASIAQFLENSRLRSIIDKIDFYENKGVIERIESISRGVNNWGWAATSVLAVVAILVTFNAIRLTIYNQKQEIEIMRLVGASNWQIRGPFIAEGGLYGFFAGLMALAIFYPSILFVSDKMAAFASGISLSGYFMSNIAQIVFIVVVFGVALGMISSAVAINRHLKI